MEMTGRGKRGNPETGFPLFPPPLEIVGRFPHSHRHEFETRIHRIGAGSVESRVEEPDLEVRRRRGRLPHLGAFWRGDTPRRPRRDAWVSPSAEAEMVVV
jgi:hypothetical protein